MIDPADIERARSVHIELVIESRGVKLRGRTERTGPCPRCGGTDRFSINTRKQVFHCRRCQRGGDVITLVQHIDGVDFPKAVETLLGSPVRLADTPHRADGPKGSGSSEADEYERQQHRKAAWFWQNRKPITGTPAELYLRKARRYQGTIPLTLAYLPPLIPQHHHALIAAFAIAQETAPGRLLAPVDVGAVHLTFLKADGSGKADTKPNKIILGRPCGLPIMVAPPGDALTLVIAEGIEDGLTAHEATGAAAWAAGAAGFMPALADKVPGNIESVTIMQDADATGRRNAELLAIPLIKRGIEVRLSTPAEDVPCRWT